MSESFADLPPWAAITVAVLVLLGSVLTLIGSVGLARLGRFYDRVHAPTMGSSAGVACISFASILCFSVLQSRLAVHEALIFIFVTVTTPVTLILLARAALFRDRVEGDSPLTPEMEAALAGVRLDQPMTEDDDLPPGAGGSGQGMK